MSKRRFGLSTLGVVAAFTVLSAPCSAGTTVFGMKLGETRVMHAVEIHNMEKVGFMRDTLGDIYRIQPGQLSWLNEAERVDAIFDKENYLDAVLVRGSSKYYDRTESELARRYDKVKIQEGFRGDSYAVFTDHGSDIHIRAPHMEGHFLLIFLTQKFKHRDQH